MSTTAYTIALCLVLLTVWQTQASSSVELAVTTPQVAERVESTAAFDGAVKLKSYTPIKQKGWCSNYGDCDKGAFPPIPRSCPNNTQAVVPDFDLSKLCPEYQSLACCSKDQYTDLLNNIVRAQIIFGKCKACLQNFKSFWCAFTCHPDQSTFVDVLEVMMGTQGKLVVNHTSVTLDSAAAQGFYHSCAGVRDPGSGSLVLQNLGVTDVPSFYHFLGQAKHDGSGSPFLIEFTVTTPQTPTNGSMAPVLTPCNTTNTDLQCSCVDCNDMCPSIGNNIPNHSITQVHMGRNLFDPVDIALMYTFCLVMCICIVWRSRDTQLENKEWKPALLTVAAVVFLTMVITVLYGVASPDVHVVTYNTYDMPYDVSGLLHVVNSYMQPWIVAMIIIVGSLLVLVLVVHVWLCVPAARRMSLTFTAAIRARDHRKEHVPQGMMHRVFAGVARMSARYPWTVLLGSLLVTGLCGIGIITLKIESDPVKLWVPPDSELIQQRDEFNAHFDPFYRVEQMVITTKARNDDVLSLRTLIAVKNMIERVKLVNVSMPYKPDSGVVIVGNQSLATFDSLCYKPIPGRGCVVESPTEWFYPSEDSWSYKSLEAIGKCAPQPGCVDAFIRGLVITQCIGGPFDAKCRGPIGAPTFYFTVLGGYTETKALDALKATTIFVTLPLNNKPNLIDAAEAWETEFLKLMKQFAIDYPFLNIAYSAERSVGDELSRSASSDVPTVAISYLVMFLYISLALGRLWPLNFRLLFVRTKFLLGFGAILIVCASLVISVGLVSAMGVKVTPIISEVIPFLVLAIGIDNVFIILNMFQSKDPRESIEKRLTETLTHVGTSITLASIAEAFAFCLGALTRMPAVRAFAFYSAVAILADYFLQITAFCAILVLDARRTQQLRLDCFFCFRISRQSESDEYSDYVPVSSTHGVVTVGPALEDSQQVNETMDDVNGGGAVQLVPRDGVLKKMVRKYYVPVLLHRVTKIMVIIVFTVLTLVSIGVFSHNLTFGLDQATAVPKDSYLQPYFDALANKLMVGPPVFFVVRPFPPGGSPNHPSAFPNFTTVDDQNLVCSFANCRSNSLVALANIASKKSKTSYIAPAASVNTWIDSYISFMGVAGQDSKCCRVYLDSHVDPITNATVTTRSNRYCPPTEKTPNVCAKCLDDSDYVYNGTRPNPEKFLQYLPIFRDESICNTDCGVCGWGLRDNIDVEGHFDPTVNDTVLDKIGYTRFMSYHSTLRTQADYIAALENGRALAANITQETGLNVFAYSIIYVYFEQYLYIASVAAANVGYAGAGIFILCLIVLKNLWVALLIMVTIGMILADLLGVMALWNVEFNAVSAVNFVMAIGISVEFCIHVAVAFVRTPGSHDYRMASSLIGVGSSVISGITLTKFCGVIVLAFASSEIFNIYYFRMYLAIVLLGAFHGLMFLPVLLSILGPSHGDQGSLTKPGEADSSDEEEKENYVLLPGATPEPNTAYSYRPIDLLSPSNN